LPESRWVEQQLGHPVIKAFNNIYAQHLLENGKPAGAPGRIALPVAGDDAAAKKVVLELVDELGFDAVDWTRRILAPTTGQPRLHQRLRCGRRAAWAVGGETRPYARLERLTAESRHLRGARLT
jgi:hypothetical protein